MLFRSVNCNYPTHLTPSLSMYFCKNGDRTGLSCLCQLICLRKVQNAASKNLKDNWAQFFSSTQPEISISDREGCMHRTYSHSSSNTFYRCKSIPICWTQWPRFNLSQGIYTCITQHCNACHIRRGKSTLAWACMSGPSQAIITPWLPSSTSWAPPLMYCTLCSR